MGTEVRKNFKHGFILDEQELRRIYNILAQQMNAGSSGVEFTTTFKIVFKNKITEERYSIDDVFAESNGGLWEIQSLKINLRSKNVSRIPSIMLTFEKEEIYSISYIIEGNDRNWVYLTLSMLDERIAKIKQFTVSPIAKTVLFMLSPVILAPILFVLLLTLFFPSHSNLTWSSGDIILTLCVIISLIIGAVAYFFCFPLYNFCWGDYVGTFERKRSIGKFILVGVLVALVLGVIGGIVANYLTIRTGISH